MRRKRIGQAHRLLSDLETRRDLLTSSSRLDSPWKVRCAKKCSRLSDQIISVEIRRDVDDGKCKPGAKEEDALLYIQRSFSLPAQVIGYA